MDYTDILSDLTFDMRYLDDLHTFDFSSIETISNLENIGGIVNIKDKKNMRGRKLTTEDFIRRSKLIHRNKYDYSFVDYKASYLKVLIICPIHGGFKQEPKNHLLGRGCIKCSYVRITTKNFIEKARSIHGDRYDYSLVSYKGTKIKVVIICHIHGRYEQIPNHHLMKSGCPQCTGHLH